MNSDVQAGYEMALAIAEAEIERLRKVIKEVRHSEENMNFDQWWNSSAADTFRAANPDADGEHFRCIWDAAIAVSGVKLREKVANMRHYLHEAHSFAAMSPRGKENIAAALDILDELGA